MHIEGKVTGRSIGGAATDLVVAQVHQGDTEQDAYNYHTYLPRGQTMKSCTVFLHEEEKTYGTFCINFDITNFSGLQQMLNEFLSIDDGEVSETLLDDLQNTIHSVLMDTVTEMEGALPMMGNDEKLNLIARLDKKGILRVGNSSPNPPRHNTP